MASCFLGKAIVPPFLRLEMWNGFEQERVQVGFGYVWRMLQGLKTMVVQPLQVSVETPGISS